MIDQNDQLPEGTDAIVTGASAADRDRDQSTTGSDVGNSTGGSTPNQSIDGDNSDEATTPTGISRRAKVVDSVKSGSNKLAGQAADKTRGFVGQGLERSSEALAGVSKMIGETATGIDERLGQEYGDYARRAAGAIDSAANSLASKSPDELIDDTRDFVKKSPGIALAGAAVVGFVLARLVKTGLDNDKTQA